MPAIPGAYLAGQQVNGIVDGTVVRAAQYQQFNLYGAITWLAWTNSCMFWYEDTGSAMQGVLIASSAHTAGTDPLTQTAYPPGFAIYAGGNITVNGTGGSNITGEVVTGTPFLFFATGASEEGTAGNIQAVINDPGSSEGLELNVAGPKGSVHTDNAWMALTSAGKDGSYNAGGTLVYTNTSNVDLSALTWGSSGVQVASPISGDTNSYQTERLTLYTATSTLINTTGAIQIIDAGVGIGTYHIHGRMVCLQGSTSVAQVVEVTAPSASLIGGNSRLTVVGTGETVNMYRHSSFPTNISTPSWAANAYWIYEFDLIATFSATGTVSVQGAEGTSGDSWTVEAGSYMEINPVGS